MRTFQHLKDSFEKIFQEEVDAIRLTNPLHLYEPISYSLERNGKRIRPVLLLHAASLFTSELEAIYPAASAIEFFHNFTLLHDDIMDNAFIRRGNPSVHAKYGVNSAILSGDAMSILSFRLLSRCDPSKLKPILSLFSTTSLEVCEGQQYDMEFEEKEEVNISEYLDMIKLKTAVLIACSLKMGAILAGADAHSCQLLYDFGIKIGIAFQLQDDWLDVYGTEESFGKKIGGDICENKKTFILLKAIELSDATDRSKLLTWINKSVFDPNEKIETFREIYSRSGAAEATRILMNTYHDKAIESLELLGIEDSEKDELRRFSGQILLRTS